jgi:hypothetical protein
MKDRKRGLNRSTVRRKVKNHKRPAHETRKMIKGIGPVSKKGEQTIAEIPKLI